MVGEEARAEKITALQDAKCKKINFHPLSVQPLSCAGAHPAEPTGGGVGDKHMDTSAAPPGPKNH